MRQAMMFSKRGTSSAEVDAAIAAARVPLLPYLETLPMTLPSVGGGVITANTIYLIRLPRVAAPMTLSSAEVCLAATTGNIAAGLMTTTDPVATNTEAGNATFTRVAQSAEIAASGTSTWQSLPFSASYVYQPNTNLWIAFGGTDATISLYRIVSSSPPVRADAISVSKASAYSSGIPATLTGMVGSTYTPLIKVR